MKANVINGNLKFSLHIEKPGGKHFGATDEQIDALLSLPGAVEIGVSPLYTCYVVFEVDDAADFNMDVINEKHRAVRTLLATF